MGLAACLSHIAQASSGGGAEGGTRSRKGRQKTPRVASWSSSLSGKLEFLFVDEALKQTGVAASTSAWRCAERRARRALYFCASPEAVGFVDTMGARKTRCDSLGVTRVCFFL